MVVWDERTGYLSVLSSTNKIICFCIPLKNFKYTSVSYFVLFTLSYDFIKYDKYAFKKIHCIQKYECAFPKYDSQKGKYGHA